METTTITITVPAKKGVFYYYKIEFKKTDFNRVMEVVPTLKKWQEVFAIEETGLWSVLPQ